MKFIKSFYLFEKQLKLKFDTDKHYPSPLSEIIDAYISKIETSEPIQESSHDWNDFNDYLYDNYDKTTQKVIDDVDDVGMIERIFFSYAQEMIDYLDEQGEDIENLDPSEFSYDDFDGYGYDTDTILKDVMKIDSEDFIDHTYYRMLQDWVDYDDHFIYRAMTIPHNIDDYEKFQYNTTGIFWSYHVDGADTHWGNGDKNTITLKAKVNPDNIDWENTLYKSLYDLSEEMEILIKPNQILELVSIRIESTHPIVDKLHRNDMEYYKSLGIDPYTIKNNKGVLTMDFDPTKNIRT